MNPIVVGIDLGTTNSAIARVNDAGRPELIANAEGNPITPSVIYFGSDPPLVGEQAKEMQGLGEEEIASFFKRSMGDPNFIVHLGGKDRTAVDLSALVLQKLKQDAEAALGRAVVDCVITVPAYFNNSQREATIEAGKRAGLNVLRIINEPTAAALAYGLQGNKDNQLVLVYDLGGGTFDVSLVKIAPGEITVVGTDGDHNLGGKDWDDRIATFLGQEFANAHGTNPLDDNVSFNDLLVRAEQGKKALSSRENTRIAIHHDGHRETYELTRERFTELTRDLMERTQRLMEHVMEDTQTSWAALTGVLLVGGSTRMPMVHEYVTRMSSKPPMTGVNVDEAVALGAALQATMEVAERTGRRPSGFLPGSLRKVGDVVPHSLGTIAIESDGNRYVNSIIIRKNTPVPCTRSKSYQIKTKRNGSNQLAVYMVQGESEDATQGTVVGKYVFSEISHVPRFAAAIDITFGYDESGVIGISASERSTGRTLPLTVERLSDDMSWLRSVSSFSNAQLSLPYTRHAGLQHIPGARTDQFGNAKGSEYDLAGDKSFEGYVVAVLHLYTEGFNFREPTSALEEKGFTVKRWTQVPSEKELSETLDDASQLWVISDQKQHLGARHVRIIKEFFDNGGGLYLWGDNAPFFVDANLIAKELLGSTLSGNTLGDQVVTLARGRHQLGFVSHLITTGLEHLYEGITIASIQNGSRLEPLMFGSGGELLIAVHDVDGKRAIVDGGFTRLYVKWDTAGTGRISRTLPAGL